MISKEALVHVLVRSPEYWSTVRENSAPVAQAASFEVQLGKNLTGRINVTDDYDTIEQMAFSLTRQPGRGTVTVNGPDFTYVPDPRVAWSGKDYFTIKVTSETKTPWALKGSMMPLPWFKPRRLTHSRGLQVQDGMLEETEAVVTVNIIHVNVAPQLACENSEAGLFEASVSLLNSLTTQSGRQGTDSQAAIQALATERDEAVAGDPLKLKARTSALDMLASKATQGQILAGQGTSYGLACSSRGAWSLPMARSQEELLVALNVSLLAFDSDEFEGLIYEIVDLPKHGQLYASTAITGESYSQVLADSPTSSLPYCFS